MPDVLRGVRQHQKDKHEEVDARQRLWQALIVAHQSVQRVD